MQPAHRLRSSYGIANHGILHVRHEHWNHNTPLLYEDVIKDNEGHITHLGPIVVRTGLHTGRAAKDKFIVDEPETRGHVWWGDVNRPISQRGFENMFRRVQAYLQDRDALISTTTPLLKTRVPPTRCPTSPTRSPKGWPAIPGTWSC